MYFKLCRSDYLVTWTNFHANRSLDHVSSFLIQVLFFSNFWIGQIQVDKLIDNTLDLLQCYQVDKARFNSFDSLDMPIWWITKSYEHPSYTQLGCSWKYQNKGWKNALVGQESQPRQGYLRQQWTRWKNKKWWPRVGVLRRPSFLYEDLRLPKKLNLYRILLAKCVAMLFIHAWSSPPEKSWP